MKKTLPIMIVIVILVAAGSFYGGTKYQSSKIPSRGQFTGGPQGMSGPGGMNRTGNSGMSFISGEILSKDSQSVTVKLNNGGSKIVYYSASTAIGKMATGTAEDLSVGTTVMITGKSSTDGNVTAESIQIRNDQEPFRAGAPEPAAQ